MPIILNGTTGITTPGITNTGPFTFQGTVELPAGAVGAPSLTTTGDTNTGIYFPAANQVAIATDGVQRVFVGATGDVGIGTGSPGNFGGYTTVAVGPGSTSGGILQFQGSGNSDAAHLRLGRSGSTVNGFILETRSGTNAPLIFGTNEIERARIDSAGNMGLGVTPGAYDSAYRTLNIGPTNTYAVFYGSSNGDGGSNTFGQIGLGNNFYDAPSSKYVGTGAASVYLQSGGRHRWYNAASGTAGGSISFTERMTLDASGNLGLGIVPSAWASNRSVLQLKGGTSSGGCYLVSGSATQMFLGTNAYSDGTNFIYLTSAQATLYAQSVGEHAWYNASSGTAGNAVALTQAMTLDSSGRLGIGETAPASTLVVRKDASGAVGAEISLVNYASSATNNAAQINFGLEASTYAGNDPNAQIKSIVTNGANSSSDLVYSLYNGSAFAERFRMAATGVFTTTGTSMANGSSNATAITVATATPTIIASVTITTKGKPVFVLGLGDMNPAVGGDWQNYRIYRNGTAIGKSYIGQTAALSYNLPFSVCLIDTPSAGTHTYELRAWQGVGTITYGETGDVQAPTIIAIEVM